MEPTAEQKAILAFISDRTENLLVEARAGAAKTTTLTLIAQAWKKSGLAVAFNKSMAVELQTRLPSNFEAATMNALGHRAIRGFLGRHPKLNTGKMYSILRDLVDGLKGPDRDEAMDDFAETLRAIRDLRLAGFMPEPHPAAKPIYTEPEIAFAETLDFVPTPLQRHLIIEASKISFRKCFEGEIDFDDQIYFSALMPCSFPVADLYLVDEAQDLSVLNHLMLKKMVRNRRICAVGDPCQAIYGFRGADEASMPSLAEMFKTETLYLTICFRSAEAVVKEAHFRAPDMRWRPGAPAGSVRSLQSWSPADLQSGDAIICRNNAPLFKMALALLRAQLLPELASTDITKNIDSFMKKLGKPSLTREEALINLDLKIEEKMKKSKDKGKVQDMKECISLFLHETATLGEAIGFFEAILARKGRIQLMTGHKSKGLEFDRVFFLDEHLCRDKGQDRNLRYVIITRAREELFYVRSESWSHEGQSTESSNLATQ